MQADTSKNNLAKNAAYNVIYKLLNILFPLITAGYIARVLSPLGVGRSFVVQNNVSYFVIFAVLGIPAYAIREIAKVREDACATSKIFSEMIVLNAILTTVSLFVFTVCILSIDYFHRELTLHLIYGITILINYINIDWYYQAVEDYRFIAIRSTAVKFVSLIAVFVFVHKPDDLYLYALIYSLANCGHYFINVLRIRKCVSFTLKELTLFRHLKSLIFLTLYVISIEVYAKMDITMVGILDGEIEVAFYTYAQKVINLIITFVIAITAVFMPRLSFYYANDRKEFYKLTKFGVDLMVFMSIPICFGIVSIADPLVRIWLGTDFERTIPCMIVLAFLIPLKCIGDLAGFQVMMCSGEELKLVIPHFIALFVNFILNFYMIPRWGALGASIASLITEICIIVLILILTLKVHHYGLNVKSLITVIASSLLMSVAVVFIIRMIKPVLPGMILGIIAGIVVFIGINVLFHNTFLVNDLLKRIRKVMKDEDAEEKA